MNQERLTATMIDIEFQQPPYVSEPTKEKVGFGMKKKPVDVLFETWTEEREGKTITHTRLTKGEGRQSAHEEFGRLLENSQGKSAVNMAEVINSQRWGYGKENDEIIRRSLRARLLVHIARELAPEANPWKTVQKIKADAIAENGKEARAFEALDEALGRANQEQELLLEKQLGEETERVQKFWQKFTSFKWPRRKFLENLGITATLAGITLMCKGSPKNRLANIAVEATKQLAEPTSTPPLQSTAASTSTPEQISRRDFLKRIKEAVTPPPEVPPTATSWPRKETRDAETNAIFTKGDKQDPEIAPIAGLEAKEAQPNWFELTPGKNLTIFSPTKDFEPQKINLIPLGEFIEKQGQRNSLEDYHNAAPAGQLYFGAGKGQVTTLSVDSGRFSGVDLPAEVLMKNLKEGDKISLDNEDKRIEMEFIGTSQAIEVDDESHAQKPFVDTAIEAVYESLPVAAEAREKGENQLYIIVCDPKSYDKERRTFTKRLILAFRPYKKERPPIPGLAEE